MKTVEPEFEVIDKRGKNNPIKDVAPASELKELGAAAFTSAPEDRKWIEVVFYHSFTPTQNGGIIMFGRAAGERSDGRPFVADYIFSARVEPGFDWTEIAKKRLDTFLTCNCNEFGPCDLHQVITREWGNEGIKRLQDEGHKPMPHVVELVMMAERAQRPQIARPGR